MKLTVTLPTHSYDLTIETGALDKIGTQYVACGSHNG